MKFYLKNVSTNFQLTRKWRETCQNLCRFATCIPVFYALNTTPIFAQTIDKRPMWQVYADSAGNKNGSGAIPYYIKAIKEIEEQAITTGEVDIMNAIKLHQSLADAYEQTNNFIPSIKHTKKICELVKLAKNGKIDIESCKYLIDLAHKYRYVTDFQSARQYYKEALSINSNAESAIIGLIFTEYLDNNFLSVQNWIGKLNKINQNSTIKKAFEALSKVIFSITPNNNNDIISSHFVEIERLAKENPKDIAITLIVAIAYDKINKVDFASKYYNHVLELVDKKGDTATTEDKQFRNFVYFEKGNMYLRHNMYHLAEDEFKKLVQKGVKSPVVTLLKILSGLHYNNQASLDETQYNQITEARKKTQSEARQDAKMLKSMLQYCVLDYNNSDIYNIWTIMLSIAKDVVEKHPDIQEHGENLALMYAKTKQQSFAEMKINKMLADAKEKNWNFDALEKIAKNIKNPDKMPPYIYVSNAQFQTDLNTRGGGEKELSEEVFTILGEAQDNDAIDKIVFNGKLFPVTREKKSPFAIPVRFSVAEGLQETFTIVAYDRNGNSTKEEVIIRRKAKPVKPQISTYTPPVIKDVKALDKSLIGKQYLVLIGTDKYEKNGWANLNNAVLDMETIAKKYTEKYKVDSIIKLYNASKEEIFDVLNNQLTNMKFDENDQMFIAVAGHGYFQYYNNSKNGRGYIVPKNAKPVKEDKGLVSYITYDDLKAMIRHIPCKHKLLLLDVCFGGTIDENIAHDAGATRGNMMIPDPERANAFVREKNKQFYTAVITSGGKEPVFDGRAGENSPFTKSFLNVLDMEGNIFGLLTSDEIWNAMVTDENSELKTRLCFATFGKHSEKSSFLFFKK